MLKRVIKLDATYLTKYLKHGDGLAAVSQHCVSNIFILRV
jgi:hypothetical protein